MLTNTHALVSAGLLSRRSHTSREIFAVWLGGLFPDLSVFVMVGYARLAPPRDGLWTAPLGLYWQEPWQTLSAISNSMPLYLTLILLGFIATRRGEGPAVWGKLVMLFAAGALLHTLADFPVHTDDAHVHLWPFSQWRFHSPISYWQRENHGDVVSAIEAIAGLALALSLVVRFKSWRVRLAAIACVVPYFISLGVLFQAIHA